MEKRQLFLDIFMILSLLIAITLFLYLRSESGKCAKDPCNCCMEKYEVICTPKDFRETITGEKSKLIIPENFKEENLTVEDVV